MLTTKLSHHRRWTVSIKNLGKVKNTEIEVAPLLMLVGRNNTGKSYIASTVWGLTGLWEVLSKYDAELPKWWRDFCDEAWESSGVITTSAAQATATVAYVNKALRKTSTPFCQELFGYDGFVDTVLSIKPEAVSVGLTISISTVRSSGNSAANVRRCSLIASDGTPVFEINMSGGAKDWFWRKYVFCAVLEFTIFGGEYPLFEGVYLPAARTGLVLAHRALNSQGVSGLLPQDSAPKLSRPLTNFVERFAKAYLKPQDHTVADWVQRETMAGVIKTDSEGKELFYEISGGQKIPLYATSSMITELAPFIMILKADKFHDRLVFEEPESHLHLAAQRVIARSIARLVNSGVQVTVTTHSDTFLQQINNLIQLHNHPNKLELMLEMGYEVDDIIDPAMTKAYEFVDANNETHVIESNITSEGYAVESITAFWSTFHMKRFGCSNSNGSTCRRSVKALSC